VIKFVAVNKHYINKDQTKVLALSDINLEVKKGEIFGIIGTSGAGKSTLLHMINKLAIPDSGEVWLNDKLVNNLTGNNLKAARQETAMIFQHFNLLESYTVYENIIFPLRINKHLKNFSKSQLANLINPILELTGLTNLVNNYPSQLSGGQKQRVGIARSLVNKPNVLLCDECTSALDPQTTDSILNLLKKINKDLNVTILLITHEMQVVKSICTNVAVMSHGKIVEQGDVLNLFAHGKHDITKKLLATSLKDKLPNIILQNLSNQNFSDNKNDKDIFPLIQLVFINKSASEPILSQIMREHNVNFNILQGEIQTIKDIIVGRMIIQLEANQIQFKNIEDSFNAKNIEVEILGFGPKIYGVYE